jgi:hypothetical protein
MSNLGWEAKFQVSGMSGRTSLERRRHVMLTKKDINSLTRLELQARERLLSGDWFDSWLTVAMVRDEARLMAAEETKRLNALWETKRRADVPSITIISAPKAQR